MIDSYRSFTRNPDVRVVVEEVEKYLDRGDGQDFLDALCDGIANNEFPFLGALTDAAGLRLLTGQTPRLMGLMTVISENDNGSPVVYTIDHYSVESTNKDDVGWQVSVQICLNRDVGTDGTVGGDEADFALRVTDQINMVSPESRPGGAFVGFHAEAFSYADKERAFAAARLVCIRVIRRPLEPGETVDALRGVFHY
jgi:hypothetical protein